MAATSNGTAQVDAERIAPAVQRLLMGLLRRRLGSTPPSPFTLTQQIALIVVVQDGPIRLRDLARRIGTTPATATRSTDALEAASLVERRTDPLDGRGVLVAATPLGRRTEREAHRNLVVLLDRMLEQMDASARERFVTLMTGLLEVVEESDRQLDASNAAGSRVAAL